MVQVPIVQVAGAGGPGPGAHLAGVNAILPQELAVGHGEGLADGLCNELSLRAVWGATVSGTTVSHACPTEPRVDPAGKQPPLTSSAWNTWHSIL